MNYAKKKKMHGEYFRCPKCSAFPLLTACNKSVEPSFSFMLMLMLGGCAHMLGSGQETRQVSVSGTDNWLQGGCHESDQ